MLKELGFNTKLKIINADNYFTVIGNHSTPDLDTGWSDWFQDYPHPNDFFQPLLAGEGIQPTNNSNFAQIDDPALNKKITKLGEEQLGPEQEKAYAELDKKYMEEAPWAPYGTRTLSTFVSDDDQPRKHHLQPDVRPVPDQLRIQVARRGSQNSACPTEPSAERGPWSLACGASCATASRSPSSASSS